MKVSGSGKAQGPSKSKKGGGASQTDGSFGAMLSGRAGQAATTGATQSIAQVDALLAIQGAEDPTQGAARKRMRQRANDILDELDGLRDAMLSGSMTLGHMIDVADVVASHREQVTDPELTAIMDEIDLRAQVELAKMRVAMDAKKRLVAE